MWQNVTGHRVSRRTISRSLTSPTSKFMQKQAENGPSRRPAQVSKAKFFKYGKDTLAEISHCREILELIHLRLESYFSPTRNNQKPIYDFFRKKVVVSQRKV